MNWGSGGAAFVLAVLGFLLFPSATRADDPIELAIPGLTDAQREQFLRGHEWFEKRWSEPEGRSLPFNAHSCRLCHRLPTVGGHGKRYNYVVLFGALQGQSFDPLAELGGPVLQVYGAGPREVVPEEANAVSLRKPRSLFGLGLVEAIPDADLEAIAERNGGRLVYGPGGRVQRFGTQSQKASLAEVVRSAMRDELGVPPEVLSPSEFADLVAFVRFLEPHPILPTTGLRLFRDIGCASCHHVWFRTSDEAFVTDDGETVDVDALKGRYIYPFSDFLLHDMGPELSDGVALGQASVREFRTAPLWGYRFERASGLHDGRSNTLEHAMSFHGGEAADEREAFFSLSSEELRALEQLLDAL